MLLREAHGVVGDVSLDRIPHLGRRPEETVGGDEPVEGLVRALEVVAVDVEREPPHVVGEVGEDRPTQKLRPECLPEALHLAQRLGVLGPAPDVPDAVAPERPLKLRLATPRRVLGPVVGENLLRRPVRGDSALEGLQHQLRPLMVCRRVRDDEARVVVHEDCQVHSLVASEQEGEDVRLPELIRRRALEASHRMLSRLLRRRCRLQQALLVQDPAHLRLAHAQRLEAGQDVPDAPSAVLRVLLAKLRDRPALRLPVGRGRLPRRRT